MLTDSLRDLVLAEIESFLAETRLRPAQIGEGAGIDSSFVARLRKGDRSPTLDTVDKARAFMARELAAHRAANAARAAFDRDRSSMHLEPATNG